MSVARFYCPRLAAGELTLGDAEAHHALQSRRLRPGDPVFLFDGRGGYAHAVLAEPNQVVVAAGAGKRARRAGAVTVRVASLDQVPAPTHTLTLVVAACKGPRLDWLIEKCTELGVTRLLLAEFARSVVQPGTAHLDKLRRTALEACKQSGRLWLPELDAGLVLDAALASAGDAALLVAHACPEAQPLGVCLQGQTTARLCIVVGPEGGITPDELARLRARGAEPVSLAAHTLRVETAAVAVAAAWAARGLPT